MAKKAQKVRKGKHCELLIVNPNTAGIDVASTNTMFAYPKTGMNIPTVGLKRIRVICLQ